MLNEERIILIQKITSILQILSEKTFKTNAYYFEVIRTFIAFHENLCFSYTVCLVTTHINEVSPSTNCLLHRIVNKKGTITLKKLDFSYLP